MLTFEHGGNIFTTRREMSNDFHLTVEVDGNTKEFFSEGDFSTTLFQTLRLNEPVLIGTDRSPTKPYISTVLPIFYAKQDGGYLDPYKASANFVQDQHVEMIRFAFGLGPKNSYSAKKDLLKAQDELEAAQRRVVYQQKIVADLSERVDDSPTARAERDGRSSLISSQLSELKDTVDTKSAADDALRDLLNAKEEKLRIAKRQQFDLRTRIAGIDSIRGEIDGEIRTLSLNEESKRAFEFFGGDICSRSDCGLFFSSSESYAKNLMYLKDQIKDLESNSARAEVLQEELERRIDEDEAERLLILSKMNDRPQHAAIDHLVTTVQSLTKELLEIEQKRIIVESLAEERRKYIQFENERASLQDRISNLKNNSKADFEFSKLRSKVREYLIEWLDTLETLNISRDIDIDTSFKFKFGPEPLDVIGGSTRNRLILAIHAAIFQAYLEAPDRPFRFMILDTPKQNELDGQDLTNYLEKLEGICEKFGGQLVLSSTEYHHKIGEKDKEWLPLYPGEKQPMYLGKPGTMLKPADS